MRGVMHISVIGPHGLAYAQAYITSIAHVTGSLVLKYLGKFSMFLAIPEKWLGQIWHFVEAGGIKRLGPAV